MSVSIKRVRSAGVLLNSCLFIYFCRSPEIPAPARGHVTPAEEKLRHLWEHICSISSASYQDAGMDVGGGGEVDPSRPVRSLEGVGVGGGGRGPGRVVEDVMVQKEIWKLESARAEVERERAALDKEREAWQTGDECARLMREELVLLRGQVCVCVC